MEDKRVVPKCHLLLTSFFSAMQLGSHDKQNCACSLVKKSSINSFNHLLRNTLQSLAVVKTFVGSFFPMILKRDADEVVLNKQNR